MYNEHESNFLNVPPYLFLAENFVLMWHHIDPRNGKRSMVAMDKIPLGNDRMSASNLQ